MPKKLTLTVDEQVVHQDLMASYSEMATDEAREAEAQEWTEATTADNVDFSSNSEQLTRRRRQPWMTYWPRCSRRVRRSRREIYEVCLASIANRRKATITAIPRRTR